MMNPNTIYRKTEAGVTEVQRRALGLRAELRRLLILLDGVATIGRLAAFVRGSEIDFLIAELEVQGLVTTGVSAPPAVAPTAVSSAPNAEGLMEPTAAQMLAVRRTAISKLHEILGPSADDLALKIERCKDANEMRAAVNEVRQVLDRQMGAASGQRFLDAVRGAAEGTR